MVLHRSDAPNPTAIRDAIKAFEAAKAPLNDYVRLVNSVANQADETIYDVLWAAERWKTEKGAVGPPFRFPDAVQLSRLEVTARGNALRDISAHLATAPLPVENPWIGFRPTRLLSGDQEQALALLRGAASELGRLQETVAEMASETKIPIAISLDQILKFDVRTLELFREIPSPFDESFAKASIVKRGRGRPPKIRT